MKKVLLVCSRCGYEGRFEVFSFREAKEMRIPTHTPACPRCGSAHVRLLD